MSKLVTSLESKSFNCNSASINGNINADTVNGLSIYSSVVPSMRMVGYDQKSLNKYLSDISVAGIYTESYVVAYAHGVATTVDAYAGGVYSPTQNRIYFAPHTQGNQTNWHYIQDLSNAPVSKSLMAGPLFNKF